MDKSRFLREWTIIYYCVGAYTFILPFIILIINCMTKFNKVDKSTQAFLEPKEWPTCLTLPLNVYFLIY